MIENGLATGRESDDRKSQFKKSTCSSFACNADQIVGPGRGVEIQFRLSAASIVVAGDLGERRSRACVMNRQNGVEGGAAKRHNQCLVRRRRVAKPDILSARWVA